MRALVKAYPQLHGQVPFRYLLWLTRHALPPAFPVAPPAYSATSLRLVDEVFQVSCETEPWIARTQHGQSR